tara:strand:- start:52804 stop:52998 length:195 start_codon:yes stop_codon:yes gene_type:complete
MFNLYKNKKKIVKRNGKLFIVDFDNGLIEEPKGNDIIIEQEKLKEIIKKPIIKIKEPKKGKKLF